MALSALSSARPFICLARACALLELETRYIFVQLSRCASKLMSSTKCMCNNVCSCYCGSRTNRCNSPCFLLYMIKVRVETYNRCVISNTNEACTQPLGQAKHSQLKFILGRRYQEGLVSFVQTYYI